MFESILAKGRENLTKEVLRENLGEAYGSDYAKRDAFVTRMLQKYGPGWSRAMKADEQAEYAKVCEVPNQNKKEVKNTSESTTDKFNASHSKWEEYRLKGGELSFAEWSKVNKKEYHFPEEQEGSEKQDQFELDEKTTKVFKQAFATEKEAMFYASKLTEKDNYSVVIYQLGEDWIAEVTKSKTKKQDQSESITSKEELDTEALRLWKRKFDTLNDVQKEYIQKVLKGRKEKQGQFESKINENLLDTICIKCNQSSSAYDVVCPFCGEEKLSETTKGSKITEGKKEALEYIDTAIQRLNSIAKNSKR